MRLCAFPACRKRRKGAAKIYLHRFPVEEPIRKRWISWIRDDCGFVNFHYQKYSSLCYRHFEEYCFRDSGRLKPDSYPSITPEMLDEIPEAHVAQLKGSAVSNVHKLQGCRGQMDKDNLLSVSEAPEVMLCEVDPTCFEEMSQAENDVSVRLGSRETSQRPALVKPSASNVTKRKAYAGDLTPDDFSTPQDAKQHFLITKRALTKSKSRTEKLRKKYAAAVKKIEKLQCLLAHYKEKDLCSSDSCSDLVINADCTSKN